MEQSANYRRRGQGSEPLLVEQPEEAGPGVAGHQPVGGVLRDDGRVRRSSGL